MVNRIRPKLVSLTDFLCWASIFLAVVCFIVIVVLGISWFAMWNIGGNLDYFLGCPLSDSGYCMPPMAGGRDKFYDSAALASLALMAGFVLTCAAIAFHGAKKKLLDGAKK